MRILAIAILLILPQDVREELKAARAELKKGDLSSAERRLKKLAFENRDSWPIRRLLLSTYEAGGRAADAEKLCREYLALHADHVPAKAALAMALLAQGRPKPALDAATGGDIRARAARALALEALGRDDEALALTKEFTEEHKKKKDVYLREETEALARGLELHARLAGDVEAFRLVLRALLPDLIHSDPNDASLKAWQARLNVDKNNFPDAMPLLEAALAANPQCADALALQARISLAQGNGPGATASADAALKVNSAHLDAHLVKLHAAADAAKAAEALAKAVEALPDSDRLHAVAAALAHARGDAAAHDAAVKKALANNPASPLPWLETGAALVAGGSIRFDEAHGFFKKAAETAPKNLEAQLQLGLSAFRVGDEAAARAILKEANKKDPYEKRADNAVTLLNDFERDYAVSTAGPITLRLPKADAPWLERPAREVATAALAAWREKLGAAPDTIHIDFFAKAEDLAARAAGGPVMGSSLCFGRVIAVLEPPSRLVPDGPIWAAELTGQVARACAAAASKGRAPRWFLDGLASLATRAWQRDPDLAALRAGMGDGKVEGAPPATVALWLESTDLKTALADPKPDAKAFAAWLERRTKALKVVMPPKEEPAKLAEASDAAPKDAARAAAAARAWLARNDADKALKYAKRAVEADEKSAEARSAVGRALVKKKKAEEAHDHLAQAVALGADDYRTWYALGVAELELDELKNAAAAFEKAKSCLALVSDPEGDSVYRRLLDLYSNLKDPPAEERTLSELVARDPYAWKERLKLSRKLQAAKDWDGALALADQGVRIQARDRDVWTVLAGALAGAGRFEPAIEARLAAIALIVGEDRGSDRADEHAEIGRLWLKVGKKEKARESAKNALREAPGHEAAQKVYEEALKE